MALLDDILADLDDEEPKKKVKGKEPDTDIEEKEEKEDKDRMDFKDDDPDLPPKGLKNDKEPGKIQFCAAFLKEFGGR